MSKRQVRTVNHFDYSTHDPHVCAIEQDQPAEGRDIAPLYVFIAQERQERLREQRRARRRAKRRAKRKARKAKKRAKRKARREAKRKAEEEAELQAQVSEKRKRGQGLEKVTKKRNELLLRASHKCQCDIWFIADRGI